MDDDLNFHGLLDEPPATRQDAPKGKIEKTDPFHNIDNILGREERTKLPFTPVTTPPQGVPTELDGSAKLPTAKKRVDISHLRASSPPKGTTVPITSNRPAIRPDSGIKPISYRPWSSRPVAEIVSSLPPEIRAQLEDELLLDIPTRQAPTSETARTVAQTKIPAAAKLPGPDLFAPAPKRTTEGFGTLRTTESSSTDGINAPANDDLELDLQHEVAAHPPLTDDHIKTLRDFTLPPGFFTASPTTISDSAEPNSLPRPLPTEEDSMAAPLPQPGKTSFILPGIIESEEATTVPTVPPTHNDTWEDGPLAAPTLRVEPSILPAVREGLRQIVRATENNVSPELSFNDPLFPFLITPKETLPDEVLPQGRLTFAPAPITPVQSATLPSAPPEIEAPTDSPPRVSKRTYAPLIPAPTSRFSLATLKNISNTIQQKLTAASNAIRSTISSILPPKIPTRATTFLHTHKRSTMAFVAAAGLALFASRSIHHETSAVTKTTVPTIAVTTPQHRVSTVQTPTQTTTSSNRHIQIERGATLTQHQTISLQGHPTIPDTFLSALYGYMHSQHVIDANLGYHYQPDQATHMFASLLRQHPKLRHVLGGNQKGCSFRFATNADTHEVVLVQAYSSHRTPLLSAPITLPGTLR